MPIDAMHKELLIRMSLFLGNEDHKQLSCTAKTFKNLDIEKALRSERVMINDYLLNKIRCYTLPDTTNQDIDQPRAEASATAISELVIAFNAADHLTNDDLKKLADLGFIHEKTEAINLGFCGKITDLSPLISCAALASLDLSYCDQITDLSPLQSCTALTDLFLWGCFRITNLSPLANCMALTNLTLNECKQITNLSPLASCTALTSLNLENCDQVTDLSLFADHPTLSSLIGPNGDEVDLTSLSNTQQPGP